LVSEPPPGKGPIAIVPVADAQIRMAIELAERLRGAGFSVDLGYSGNVGKRMKRANKVGAVAAIVLGETEIVAGKATVRDMQTGEQAEVPLTSLEDHLARFR